MKRFSFISLLLAGAALAVTAGCDEMDYVRANNISVEVDGTLFRSHPDTTYVVWNVEHLEQEIKQYEDYFTFSFCEDLYSKKDDVLVLNLFFTGDGVIELHKKYPLMDIPEGHPGSPIHFAAYNGTKYGIDDAWIEFSEFGVDEMNPYAYASGSFGFVLDGFSITGGTFGRMLKCNYYNHIPAAQ